jgi:hypothetical protein
MRITWTSCNLVRKYQASCGEIPKVKKIRISKAVLRDYHSKERGIYSMRGAYIVAFIR